MPSPLEKLRKFLILESERGYDNRAVVGGLDKILPTWKTEAVSFGLPESTIQLVENALIAYPQMDIRERAEGIKTLLEQIGAANGVELKAPPLAQELNPAAHQIFTPAEETATDQPAATSQAMYAQPPRIKAG
ncbi:MAG: hypothetical protein ACYDHA_13140 [Bellilinea sp.]